MEHVIRLSQRPTIEGVLEGYGASFVLKAMLQESLGRDPLDALKDAEVLVVLLADRLARVHRAVAAERARDDAGPADRRARGGA